MTFRAYLAGHKWKTRWWAPICFTSWLVAVFLVSFMEPAGQTWWLWVAMYVGVYVAGWGVALVVDWAVYNRRLNDGYRYTGGDRRDPGSTPDAAIAAAGASIARTRSRLPFPRRRARRGPRVGGLPVTASDVPIMAFKIARLWHRRDGWWLAGVGMGGEYRSPATAYCIHSDHAAPARYCRCGFYASKTMSTATAEAISASHHAPERYSSGYVILEVQLYGVVIAHTHGYRAEKQQVLQVRLPDRCSFCSAPATRLASLTGPIQMACDGCETFTGSFSVEEMERDLGAPVRIGL